MWVLRRDLGLKRVLMRRIVFEVALSNLAALAMAISILPAW